MPVVCGGDADHPALVEMGKAIPFKRLTCTALGGERSSPGEGGTDVLLLFALLLLSSRVQGRDQHERWGRAVRWVVAAGKQGSLCLFETGSLAWVVGAPFKTHGGGR